MYSWRCQWCVVVVVCDGSQLLLRSNALQGRVEELTAGHHSVTAEYQALREVCQRREESIATLHTQLDRLQERHAQQLQEIDEKIRHMMDGKQREIAHWKQQVKEQETRYRDIEQVLKELTA